MTRIVPMVCAAASADAAAHTRDRLSALTKKGSTLEQTIRTLLDRDEARTARQQMLLDELSDLDHISAVAHVLGWIVGPPDMAAAHAIAVAKRLDWPVLTLDKARWQPAVEKLPWQVHLIELREP